MFKTFKPHIQIAAFFWAVQCFLLVGMLKDLPLWKVLILTLIPLLGPLAAFWYYVDRANTGEVVWVLIQALLLIGIMFCAPLFGGRWGRVTSCLGTILWCLMGMFYTYVLAT